jgi:hypothetical protein
MGFPILVAGNRHSRLSVNLSTSPSNPSGWFFLWSPGDCSHSRAGQHSDEYSRGPSADLQLLSLSCYLLSITLFWEHWSGGLSEPLHCCSTQRDSSLSLDSSTTCHSLKSCLALSSAIVATPHLCHLIWCHCFKYLSSSLVAFLCQSKFSSYHSMLTQVDVLKLFSVCRTHGSEHRTFPCS